MSMNLEPKSCTVIGKSEILQRKKKKLFLLEDRTILFFASGGGESLY